MDLSPLKDAPAIPLQELTARLQPIIHAAPPPPRPYPWWLLAALVAVLVATLAVSAGGYLAILSSGRRSAGSDSWPSVVVRPIPSRRTETLLCGPSPLRRLEGPQGRGFTSMGVCRAPGTAEEPICRPPASAGQPMAYVSEDDAPDGQEEDHSSQTLGTICSRGAKTYCKTPRNLEKFEEGDGEGTEPER